MSEQQVFFDVDTQVDFMLPDGRLHVPGAETIIPNLSKLMAYAEAQGTPVLSMRIRRMTRRLPNGLRIVSWALRASSAFLKPHSDPPS